MLKRYTLQTALACAAIGLAMPAAAQADPAEPILLAMASYAASNAGEDAAERAAKKQKAYARHAEQNANADCGDCPDHGDCPDCVECADCDKIAETKEGVCDPSKHGSKVTHA